MLVHLVVEGSATVFYQEIPECIFKSKEGSTHFSLHNELDPEHELIGMDKLENLSTQRYQELYQLQKNGWKMINHVMNRIYELISQ